MKAVDDKAKEDRFEEVHHVRVFSGTGCALVYEFDSIKGYRQTVVSVNDGEILKESANSREVMLYLYSDRK